MASRTAAPFPEMSGHGQAAAARPVEPPMFQILWRRRKSVLLGVGIALACGLGYLLVARPMYTAAAALRVQAFAPMISGDARRAPEPSENYLNTECQVIGSTPVMALALARPGVVGLRTLDNVDRPLEFLKKNVAAEVGKKDDVIRVSFDAPSVGDACKVVDAVVESYKDFQLNLNGNTAGAELATLASHRDKADAERNAIEGRMVALRPFAVGQGGPRDSERAGLAEGRLASLGEALKGAQVESVNASVAYDSASALIGADEARRRAVESNTTPANADDVEKLRADVFRYQEALRNLERSYLPEHPMVKSTRTRLDQLTIDYVAAARQRWLESLKREMELKDRYDQQKTDADEQAIEQARKAGEYQQLEGDARRLNGQIDELSNEIKTISLSRKAQELTITVLEWGKVEAPPKPNKAKVLAGAVGAGLLLGAGLGLAREKADKKVTTGAQAGAAAGAPLLGVIPAIPALALAGRSAPTFDDAGGEMSSAIKGVVRTATYLAGPDTRMATLLVTSPAGGDGRSTVVAHLAAAFALAGKSVAIVDADFRSPAQHKLFEIDDRNGLSSVLAAGAAPVTVLRPTRVKGLDIMPAGPVLANPSEMLNSPAFAELLADLAERYDHVLIDSPALSSGPDARIAAAHCERTILVLDTNKANKRVIAQARDGLVNVGANLLGVVVNEVPRRAAAVIAPTATTPEPTPLRNLEKAFKPAGTRRNARRG